MSEPTVIQRMCAAHWRRGREGIRTDWALMTPEGREEDCRDMIAAIRELQDVAWQKNQTEIADWLRDQANEHERRSEVKGGDS